MKIKIVRKKLVFTHWIRYIIRFPQLISNYIDSYDTNLKKNRNKNAYILTENEMNAHTDKILKVMHVPGL